MADYQYKDDGKLHTRYSELIRCTPGQIDRVLQERFEGRTRAETESMIEGTIRHEMLQEYSEKHKTPYHAFGLDWPVSHVEHEFATEILPGVVLHSRPDLVCGDVGILPDYKTVLDGKHGWQKNLRSYGWRPKLDPQGNIIGSKTVESGKQHQLKLYAWQIGMHGILIKRGAFLCEIWNGDRDEILGYQVVEFDITLADMAAALQWVRPRVALLASAIEEYKKCNKTLVFS